MKNRVIAWMLALCLLLSLTACGSSGSSGGAVNKSADRTFNAAMETGAAEDGYYYDTDTEAAEATAAEDNGGSGASGDSGDTQSAYQNAKVKLIRRASLNLETKEFDAAVQGLESLVNELGGYVEESNLNQGGYGSTYRSADYTIRVPAQKYDDFLSRMSSEEHCHLTRKDESTEDVGQAYFDTETRLKTLRTKLERLQELLSQAKHMDDIITLEQAITDTEYDIERYSSTLNRYDSLIGYATFHVSISQVVTISDTDTITFGERLANSFMGGLEDFIDGVQGFLIWLVGHIFSIALLVVLILLARALLRRRREKRAQRLREQGIDPNAVKKTGWRPLNGKGKKSVPKTPFAPPHFGRASGNTQGKQGAEAEAAVPAVPAAPEATDAAPEQAAPSEQGGEASDENKGGAEEG